MLSQIINFQWLIKNILQKRRFPKTKQKQFYVKMHKLSSQSVIGAIPKSNWAAYDQFFTLDFMGYAK